MHVATPRNTLRSSEHIWRQSPNAVAATHPRVAGFLADTAHNFADSAEPLVESWPFLIVGAVAAIGLFVLRVGGLA